MDYSVLLRRSRSRLELTREPAAGNLGSWSGRGLHGTGAAPSSGGGGFALPGAGGEAAAASALERELEAARSELICQARAPGSATCSLVSSPCHPVVGNG